jgi:chromate transporter
MHSCLQVCRLFLYLGATSIGGPAVHIARMDEEFVRRRRWISQEEFLDMLAASNLIPGPNSTELALHIGYRRAGVAGLLVAGLSFIAPAALGVLALAWAYVRFGNLPATGILLYCTKPVVLAIILKAAWDLGKTAIRSRFLVVLALVAAALNLAAVHELFVLFLCGLAAVAAQRPGRAVAVFAFMPAMIPAPAAASLFWYFLKIGAMLYGSGYVLIALLRTDLVENFGWLTEQQLLDAVAVGQITPGPVFTTATFVGYLLGGWPGALLATVGIFLPAFVLVLATQSLVRRARRYATAALFLDGVNAAAIALIVVTAAQLGTTAIVDIWTITLFAACVVLLAMGVASIWLIAGTVGIALALTIF